jgi:hypothetical protein
MPSMPISGEVQADYPYTPLFLWFLEMTLSCLQSGWNRLFGSIIPAFIRNNLVVPE